MSAAVRWLGPPSWGPKLALGVACLAMGCDGFESEAELAPSFEEFLARSVTLPDGRIVADEDILFADEEAVRAYYDQQLDASADRLGLLDEDDDPGFRSSVRLFGGEDDRWAGVENMHLTYCVDTGSFGGNSIALSSALDRAMDSWSRRVGVVFEQRDVSPCNRANTSVVFNVRSISASFFASAFFPSSPRSERELLVTPSAFTTSAGGRDLEGILRHELGHVLGLSHEHVWLNPLCTSEGPAEARLLTPYDVDSVMHYPQCRPSGTGGYRQTEQDYLGAFTLYGLSTALTTTVL